MSRFFTRQAALMCAALLMCLLLIVACKKDTAMPDYNPDKTQLKSLIDSVTLVYNAAVEGNKSGNFAIGSKVPLKMAIDQALQVRAGLKFTQQDVDNTMASLRRSAVAFNDKKIP